MENNDQKGSETSSNANSSPQIVQPISVNELGDTNETSLKDIILQFQNLRKYILSKWIVILLAGFVGGAVGFGYTYIAKPIYISKTTFVLEEANGSGGMLSQLGGLASLAGIDQGAGGGLFQVDNIIQLYKSRSMIEKTLLSEVDFRGKKQLLIEYYIEFNQLRDKWNKNEKLKSFHFNIHPSEKFKRIQDSILGVTVQRINSNNLKVNKLDSKSSIIEVEVKGTDEFFVKSFNDYLVENVNDFYVQTKTKKALENLEIVQHQTDSVRNVLNGAIYLTAAVGDATPNLNPTRQVLRAPALRSQFNAEANKAILTQLVQNLELAKLSLRKETPLIQVVDQPIYPLERNNLGRLSGFIFGGVIFAFFTVLILIVRKKYQQILHGE